jgi:GDP-4-dehydro-6-deoxy-D-mannose reductase
VPKKSLVVLVTGATGWTGGYLSRYALIRGARVYGVGRSADVAPGVIKLGGDITQAETSERWIKESRPDWIFHLAGIVHGSGICDESKIQETNVEGTRHLLDAVLRSGLRPRVLIAGSSAVYGCGDSGDFPIAEGAPLNPKTPYGQSKVEQDQLGEQYGREKGVHIVRTRAFNQCGPGEPLGLVCSSLASQIAKIETGRQLPVLRLLNTDSSRDFCDVRDVARGYWMALADGFPGDVLNICSGHSCSVRKIIAILKSMSTLSEIELQESGDNKKDSQISTQLGNPSLFKMRTGWKPLISLEQSLNDLLNYWRLKIQSES